MKPHKNFFVQHIAALYITVIGPVEWLDDPVVNGSKSGFCADFAFQSLAFSSKISGR